MLHYEFPLKSAAASIVLNVKRLLAIEKNNKVFLTVQETLNCEVFPFTSAVKVLAHEPFDLEACNEPLGNVTRDLVDNLHLTRTQVKKARHLSSLFILSRRLT